MRSTMLLIILVLCAGSAGVVFHYVTKAIRNSRGSVRTHMDTLPVGLRLIWPAVNFLQFYILQTVPTSKLIKRKNQLEIAGLGFLLKAADFIAIQMICSLIFSFLTLWMASLLHATLGTKIWLFISFGYFGWVYPLIWMRDRTKKRNKEILRSLPSYLDMITLCCQAGLSLTGSIAQAVDKGPKGALRDEFDRMLRDMRAGMNRMDSLRAMAERTDNENIKSLVSSLIQAESLGASIANTLADISDQRRTERFQKAEKLAMEAPVKMIGPLVIFIFPVTFIIIFFPLVMQYLESNK